MTFEKFFAAGKDLSARAKVLDGLHGYFLQHARRLHRACELFELFNRPLGDVLEMGPFFGYIPFFLRPNASTYTVLEGDDPTVRSLLPLYQENGIAFSYVDFFEQFGPIHSATHRLALSDSTYDTILCWETMEHFNFNPVKFARELHRVLKPGGRVYVTVPNRASFQTMFSLLSGRGEQQAMDSFYRFEDYESGGKKAFYGFHWHEYTDFELRYLFAKAGLHVQTCKSFTEFQGQNVGFGRQLARMLSRFGTKLMPRHGTNIMLVAEKPAGNILS